MALPASLWARSRAWRWTLILTLLATATVVLTSPWHPPATNHTSTASYTPAASVSPAVTTSTAQLAGIPSRHNLADPAFDADVKLLTSPYSPGTELHVVGVYEGALPNGAREAPWWSNCIGLEGDSATMSACHAKYAGQRTTKTITVYLNRTSTPVVLALLAYDSVRWKIVTGPQTDLRKIIIGGYHGQDIEGVADQIPVEVYSHESSPCLNCARQAGYFYAYKKDSAEYRQATQKLLAITGLNPTSFQGAYRSDRFTILAGASATGSAQAMPSADVYTGRDFSNHVELANKTILLPDGAWKAIAYSEAPTSRGTEYLLTLTQVSSLGLPELLVIRLQTARDNRGFAQYQACNQPADYDKHVSNNEALGPQLCYWSNHLTTPWQQPIFQLAASHLQANGATPPATALALGFHKADGTTSMTTQYYTFSAEHSEPASTRPWGINPWNPGNANADPEKAVFLKQRLAWAADWYQLFSAAY